jgi:hypothetical protein
MYYHMLPQFLSSQNTSLDCLVEERRILPHHPSTVSFAKAALFEGRFYVARIAACFDDEVCLADVMSSPLLVTSSLPILTVDEATLLNQSSSQLYMQVHAPCFVYVVHLLSGMALRHQHPHQPSAIRKTVDGVNHPGPEEKK